MSMFCYQCQETAGNKGCTVKGVCGKKPETANLQDLLIWLTKGISFLEQKTGGDREVDVFIIENLFSTITNANFNADWFENRIDSALKTRDKIKSEYKSLTEEEKVENLPEPTRWTPKSAEEIYE